MQIYGPAHLHGAQPINAPHTARLTQATSPNATGAIQDELQISDAGKMVDEVRQMPEMRMDRIKELRQQIASGTYETPEKLDIALGRLLDEMG